VFEVGLPRAALCAVEACRLVRRKTSISIVVRSFEMMAKDLEKLAILAEREIHESGRWPEAEPYPVQRA
jgi:hypothetical protein